MGEEERATVWCVLRRDDNGQEFVVKRGLTKEEARRLAKELEDRGHKQTYWVERRIS